MNLKELVEFYDARDQFLGHAAYDERRDYEKAWHRLKASRHPEAIYICSLFPDKPPANADVAYKVFLAQGNHPIALCYAGCTFWSKKMVKRAAKMGHSFAQGVYSLYCNQQKGFVWAQKAVLEGNREGFWTIGQYYMYGGEHGYCLNYEKAGAAYKRSAELGYVYGILNYALKGFEKTDPKRFFWLGQAALRYNQYSFMTEVDDYMRAYQNGCFCKPVLLIIGQILAGNIDTVKGQVFGSDWGTRNYNFALEVSSLYDTAITSARAATLEWMFVAKQLGFCRDVARLIGTLVWDNRSDFIKVK
jgi:hypothetical protein